MFWLIFTISKRLKKRCLFQIGSFDWKQNFNSYFYLYNIYPDTSFQFNSLLICLSSGFFFLYSVFYNHLLIFFILENKLYELRKDLLVISVFQPRCYEKVKEKIIN